MFCRFGLSIKFSVQLSFRLDQLSTDPLGSTACLPHPPTCMCPQLHSPVAVLRSAAYLPHLLACVLSSPQSSHVHVLVRPTHMYMWPLQIVIDVHVHTCCMGWSAILRSAAYLPHLLACVLSSPQSSHVHVLVRPTHMYMWPLQIVIDVHVHTCCMGWSAILRSAAYLPHLLACVLSSPQSSHVHVLVRPMHSHVALTKIIIDVHTCCMGWSAILRSAAYLTHPLAMCPGGMHIS